MTTYINPEYRDILSYVLQGIEWSNKSSKDYWEAYPEAAVDYDLVTEMGILIYLGGPHAGQSCINWTVGGTCEWCGRSVHVCVPGSHCDTCGYLKHACICHAR